MADIKMTDIIYDYFSMRILFGYYATGDCLPSIGYICRQFQVSALTVRAALARLQEEGFIATAERKVATVVYRTDERSEERYASYLLSRIDGINDICQYADILFDPIAAVYFGMQSGAAIKRIRSQLKKARGHEAKQIIRFCAEIMRPLNNPLLLNLYWEVVRYLQIPYLHDGTDFGNTSTMTADSIERVLVLTELDEPDRAAEEMRAFSRKIMSAFFEKLYASCGTKQPVDQVPFRWQIYRERPQLCYTLAGEIMQKIDRQVYQEGELLPSCKALAEEYGVSLITMRRTLQLLNDIHATETLNGIGTRVNTGKRQVTPNFSQPQIRKSLRLFLQALQLCALTCGSVAVHTLTTLEAESLRQLEQKLQGNIDRGMPYLTGEACIRFIGENSPSPLIQEVYHQLCQLLLWGNALHIFYDSPEKNRENERYTAALLRNLQHGDVSGFAKTLSELITGGAVRSKAHLLELGLPEKKLI